MSEAAKPENERRKFRAIKGTRDILPPDSALWNWFEKTARSVMESYNFGEIRTPIFEETELFARAIGAETDVVSKEMFSFDDRPIELEAPKNLGDYDRYISDLERMLASGQIPATAMDRRKIDALKAKKMELDALRNQRATTTSPSPSSDEPFFSLVADLLLIDDSISSESR